MKALQGILLSAVLLCPGSARAVEIHIFDRMADQDQIDYIELLEQSVRDSIGADQQARLKEFFAPRDTGEGVSGMGQFELNLALGRVADLEMAGVNAKSPRLEVEDVMYATLERNGFTLPKHFRPAAAGFHQKYPLNKPVSKEVAERALAQFRAEVARKTGDVPRAELENPPDAAWVARLDFAEPRIVRALFTGDFRLSLLRSQVLTYIASMNENLKSVCPDLYDSTITSKAEGQIGWRLANGYLTGIPRGDLSDLRMQLERGQMDTDSGARDAATLYRVAPEKCRSVIVTRIYSNMKVFVQPR